MCVFSLYLYILNYVFLAHCRSLCRNLASTIFRNVSCNCERSRNLSDCNEKRTESKTLYSQEIRS